MADEDKKMKVEFAPGCFDSFDGTQEELDEIIALITEMAESGELSDKVVLASDEDLADLPEDFAEKLAAMLGASDEDIALQRKRTLN